MSGYTVLYVRMSELLANLAIGRGDGRYARIMKNLARVDLLILDDFGLAPLTADSRRDLFEIVEERHGRKSMIVTSQIPVEKWHTAIGDPTIADAILDRLIHDAYRITMKGESMRKVRSKLTKPGS
jgi:DNA replication protein DnaC